MKVSNIEVFWITLIQFTSIGLGWTDQNTDENYDQPLSKFQASHQNLNQMSPRGNGDKLDERNEIQTRDFVDVCDDTCPCKLTDTMLECTRPSTLTRVPLLKDPVLMGKITEL